MAFAEFKSNVTLSYSVRQACAEQQRVPHPDVQRLIHYLNYFLCGSWVHRGVIDSALVLHHFFTHP